MYLADTLAHESLDLSRSYEQLDIIVHGPYEIFNFGSDLYVALREKPQLWLSTSALPKLLSRANPS